MGKGIFRQTRFAFGYNLERLRKERGLTQVAMAEKIGCARSQYHRHTAGQTNPRFDAIRNYARKLKVDPQEFFGPPVGTSMRTIETREMAQLYNQLEEIDRKLLFRFGKVLLQEQLEKKEQLSKSIRRGIAKRNRS